MPAVHVAIEAHALLLYFSQLGQGKNLKAAAVREDRPVPGHEAVQTAEAFYEPVARADVEVIGVGQLDLAAYILQILCRERTLYRALRADVHEHRRLRRAVRTAEFPAPRAAFGF